MEFDWTTFILEIINFLILVWILKRFLYKPVLDVIDKRRAGIESTLADAQRIATKANELKQQNEQNLMMWETEKEEAQTQLMTELASVRERKMANLDVAIAEEAGRRRVLNERHRGEFERLAEEKGIKQGAEFSAKFLSRLASPELEATLCTLLLEDLQHLSSEDQNAVIQAAVVPGTIIKVKSAFILNQDRQKELSNALLAITDRVLPIEYEVEPALVAGLKVNIGPWVLHANLGDELKFFSGALHHAN